MKMLSNNANKMLNATFLPFADPRSECASSFWAALNVF